MIMLILHQILRLNIGPLSLCQNLAEYRPTGPAHILHQILFIKRQIEMMKGIHLHPRMDWLTIDNNPVHIKNKCSGLMSQAKFSFSHFAASRC